MGMFLHSSTPGSSSSTPGCSTPKKRLTRSSMPGPHGSEPVEGSRPVLPKGGGIPDLTRFEVLSREVIGKHTLVRVRYPDAENYDGLKVMVFETTVLGEALKKGRIDPHFLNFWPSPIARFEPTERGVELARAFLRMLK